MQYIYMYNIVHEKDQIPAEQNNLLINIKIILDYIHFGWKIEE